MLDKEFKYYLENQDDLVVKYNGKFIVIIGEDVIGVYDSQIEAYEETAKVHKLGTFFIHQVGPGKENFTQVFHSRVAFS